MNTFSIRDAFKKGWEIFKSNKRVLIASTFVIMVAGAFSKEEDRMFVEAGLSAVLIALAILVVNVILQIGWIKLLLKLIDGDVTTVRELINHSRLFWRYAFAYVALGLLAAIGFLLLIIPGFYVILTYGFVPILVIDEHMKVGDAFRKSKELSRGRRFKLLGLMIAMGVANAFGVLALFVGLFVSIPVSMLAYLSVYRKLLNESLVTK